MIIFSPFEKNTLLISALPRHFVVVVLAVVCPVTHLAWGDTVVLVTVHLGVDTLPLASPISLEREKRTKDSSFNVSWTSEET